MQQREKTIMKTKHEEKTRQIKTTNKTQHTPAYIASTNDKAR
jgi:hypothetical protein